MMTIDKKVVESLRSNYGDAFYLLDSNQFISNFKELKETFSHIYPHFNIAYSYKTNYTPKFCRIVKDLGGYAEVVSEMELEIAKRVGCDAYKIIWNGPIMHQLLQSCQHRGPIAFVQQRCRILLERRLKCFCIRGFEKDQIPGRNFGGVLADGIVDAVLFGIAFQPTDAGLADFHAGYATVLPQKGADTLFALGCLGLVQPKRCFYRPQDSPGRQFRGGDHQVE